jgi:integrase
MTVAERPPRTVAELLDTWHAGMVARRCWSPGTVRRHRSNIDRHLARALADYRVEELAIDHVDALDALLVAEGLAPATRKSVHGTLRQALGHAVRRGHVGRNVAALAGGPAAPRPEVLVPTDGQVRLLLELAAGYYPPWQLNVGAPAWVHPFLRLAAYTGARPGELAALRWADVDLERGELLIRATARADETGKGYAVGETTKTGHARRIALDARTTGTLVHWRPTELDPASLVFPAYPGLARLSPTSELVTCAPLPAHAPRRWFRRLADRAGIDPRCTLYSLRHWHASHLLRRGAAITQVAERLGHANPHLTLNVYGRHVPAGDRALADLLDRGDE